MITSKKTFHTRARAAAILSCILLGTITASAATISTFTANASQSTPFLVTGLTTSFTGSEATVSGTVTCNSESTCTGPAITFNVGIIGLTATTPVSAEIVGTSTAAAAGAIPALGVTFTVGSGSFDKPIYSASLPPVGSLNVSGDLDLTILAGQSIELPLNFFVGAQAVPEPSTFAFLGLGLLGLAAKFRRK
jgi:PEP-CTERM motif